MKRDSGPPDPVGESCEKGNTQPVIFGHGRPSSGEVMSHQVAESSVLKKESTEIDVEAVQAMKQIQVEEETKPEIVIKATDLNIVIAATHLSRNNAIELIQNAEGDIKGALRDYVKK
jgi:NACalpha-BTF3-like transcription factor